MMEQNEKNENIKELPAYLVKRIISSDKHIDKGVYSVLRYFKHEVRPEVLPYVHTRHGLKDAKKLASDLSIKIPVRQTIKIKDSDEVFISNIKRDPNDYLIRLLDYREHIVAEGVYIEEDNTIGWF